MLERPPVRRSRAAAASCQSCEREQGQEAITATLFCAALIRPHRTRKISTKEQTHEQRHRMLRTGLGAGADSGGLPWHCPSVIGGLVAELTCWWPGPSLGSSPLQADEMMLLAISDADMDWVGSTSKSCVAECANQRGPLCSLCPCPACEVPCLLDSLLCAYLELKKQGGLSSVL